MNRILFLIGCALLSWSSFLFSEKNQDKLVVGTASGYAPFVSLTPDGKLEGFDVDVANLLAEELNKKIELKDFGSMPSLIMALNQGKADVIIWAISITSDRKKEMNLVHYQGPIEKSMAVLFWKTIPDQIQQLSDFKNKKNHTICVEAGTSQDAILNDFKSISLKYVDKITDAVMDVKYGKSLAVAVDLSLVKTLMTQNPDFNVKYFDLPPHLFVEGIGIGVHKKNALTNEVQKAVDRLKANGEISKLEKKWRLS